MRPVSLSSYREAGVVLVLVHFARILSGHSCGNQFKRHWSFARTAAAAATAAANAAAPAIKIT